MLTDLKTIRNAWHTVVLTQHLNFQQEKLQHIKEEAETRRYTILYQMQQEQLYQRKLKHSEDGDIDFTKETTRVDTRRLAMPLEGVWL